MALQTPQICNVVALSIKLAEKSKQRNSLSADLQPQVVQLPLWPEPTRGVPNGVLRSALFGVIKKGERRYMARERIIALEGIVIFYTGQRLDQGDLDVWASVLHFARVQKMGQQCLFTAYSMLKLLLKTDTGKNRSVLDARLSRLNATAVRIKSGKYSYEGSLIDSVYRDKDTKKYVVILNSKMQVLFAADQFTQIDRDVRHALDGKPLAQWLHGFYSTHARPFPYNVNTLHELCGSEAVLLSDFKKDLRRALEAVADVSDVHCQPFSYAIQGDLVRIEKTPSSAQRRHLAKKASKQC